jgi:hypothetical protein
MFKAIVGKLSKVNFVCTTADLWSAQNRSFLGITVHWIETANLKRMSAAIACKRFTGGHTYDKIAGAIYDTHLQFGIDGKVLRTCTDNGSNMVKAFKEYQVEAVAPTAVATVSSSTNRNQLVEAANDLSDEDIDSEQDVCVNVKDILMLVRQTNDSKDGVMDEDDTVPVLPPHMRCCSRTLNLVATTDANSALCADKAYKKLHNQAMAKASALWNLTSRSTKAADTAFDILGFRLSVPTVTRWNSHYNAISKIIQGQDDNGKINKACQALNLPVFQQTEITFLKEYVAIMKPVAFALDLLQGENNCYFGYVLPTIKSLTNNIQKTTVSYAAALKKAVLDGINMRFQQYFTDDYFILAAISHPKFKLSWVDEPAKKISYTQLLEDASSAMANVTITVDGNDRTNAEQGRRASDEGDQSSTPVAVAEVVSSLASVSSIR